MTADFGGPGARMASVLRPISLLALILALAPRPPMAAEPEGTAQEYFFREDHLTGGFYLHLNASGGYTLQAREHMGIFPFGEGSWSKKGTTFTFRPSDRKKRSYRGVLTASAEHRFLVWLDDEAPGMTVSEAEVTRQLTELSPEKISYVFFSITSDVYASDLCGTYPFRFYPEMNKKQCPAVKED